MENQNSIGIVSDEAGDLPASLVQENTISIINFKIEYGELEKIPGNPFQKIRTAEKEGIPSLIKTSQPSLNAFLKTFEEKLKTFQSVICVTISSKVSGAYNSAVQAVKFLPAAMQDKVQVIDSLTGSGSQGLIVLRVAELIKSTQLKAHEIAEQVRKEINSFKLIGAYDKPKWLEASGRLPKFLPAALEQAEKRNIKPIFAIRDGKLALISIKKNLNGLAQLLFEEFEKQTKNIKTAGKKIKIAITHGDNPEEANRLASLIKTRDNLELVYADLVCYPIGGQVGPGCLILSWQQ